jgi:fatty acid hydroxylase domain-containing protein 2
MSLLEQHLPFISEIWSEFESLQPQPADRLITSFIAMAIVPMIFFYFYGFVFYLIDSYSSEEFKANYKVQNTIRVTTEQYFDALKISFINWFIIGFPFLYIIALYLKPSYEISMPKFPTIYTFFRDLIVYILLEELFFYVSHRILHLKPFYQIIHKFHHKFTAPIAIAAIYANPIEHLISNVIPVALGPLLMHSHPTMSMLWGIMALFSTMTVHSGYDLSKLCFVFPLPYFHDWHHEKFTENFGATQLLDYILGTNKQFLLAIQRNEVDAPRLVKKAL